MEASPTSSPVRAQEQVLHILHLEDSRTDQDLIRLELEDGGLTCDIRCAVSREQFEAALKDGGFDLILADFTVPGYHGFHALVLARAVCPEVPFVFVSGTIGEDRAIETLKSGATDYVLKQRLERLVPAVQRALRESQERATGKQALDALRKSEERFREMAETIHDSFWVATPGLQQFLYVSPAYADIWQRPADELHARPEAWLQSVMEADQPRLHAARAELARGKNCELEYRIQLPDGQVRWIKERAYPIVSPAGEVLRTIGVSSDITAYKELQAQLIQAQKMEAVGLLAGGVAHDFNNLLSVINGYAQMLIDSPALDPEAKHQLEQIYAAGRRATSLTRQLLVFSRRHTMNQQVIDLNRVIEDLAKMLGRLLGEQVQLQLALATDLPRIKADSGMTEQVIVNLAVNARDAMVAGGPLAISTAVVVVAEDQAGMPERRPGEYVRLSVRDAGCGIPADNLHRIFEPFFTTKVPGKGTGLGLATVAAIVQQHHGWVDVESAVGRGTTFHVFLPAVPRGGTASPFKFDAATVRGGNETILLVEDDAAVRTCAAAILGHYGYHVHQAGTGAQALELWQRYESTIRLLLTDVVLPDDATGVVLAAAMRTGRPDLKVILTTGYRNAVDTSAFESDQNTRILSKPYDVMTLAQSVRDLLDLSAGQG